MFICIMVIKYIYIFIEMDRTFKSSFYTVMFILKFT